MTPRAAASLSALWALFGAPVLLAWAVLVALHPRLRGDRAERLGLAVAPVAPGAIWIHAASVGEIRAAEALLPHLAGPILLTADTDTGVACARAIAVPYRGRVAVSALPVDHPVTLAPLWAEARPKAVVFVEGTAWPALSWRARAAGVPIARVSAKAGGRTRRFDAVQRLLPADRVVARDASEAAWFARWHADVIVGGDLKGDAVQSAPAFAWARSYAIGMSTREGDEVLLLSAWLPLRARGIGLLLAPRHPERFDAVAAIVATYDVRSVRRAALGGDVPEGVEVVVLDKLGELAGVAGAAAVAVIGGSFDAAIGAHSPVDAAIAGVPLIAGRHGGANEAALTACAARRVDEEGLAAALVAAIDARRPAPLARNGAGASTAALIPLGPVAPESTPRPWAWPLALAPIAWAAVRSALARPERLEIPVVAVGSANARGGGKTATARAVAAALRDAGHVVGVVVRGYRRARPGSDVRTSDRSVTAADLGDEGALFAGDGFLVAAGPDRHAGARALIALGATAIVLDDGLSARSLAIDLAIVVVDARFPSARGPIPAGERRADRPHPDALVVVHHGDSPAAVDVPYALVATRTPGPWFRGDVPTDPPAGPVAAFAGLARPADFFGTLDLPVARFRALADHQVIDEALAAELIAWAGELPLVTTAKDRVRTPFPVWWRDVDVRIDGLAAALSSRLGACRA